MDKLNIYKHLDELLSQEHECATTLLDILANERSALTSHPDELIALITTKQEKITQLEHLSQQRNLLLKQANFETKQIEDCIRWCATEGKLMDQLIEKWKTLLTTIDKCRQYNLTNGTIIESSSRRVRQTLAILHGQKPENIAYSEHGKTIDNGASRTIARV